MSTDTKRIAVRATAFILLISLALPGCGQKGASAEPPDSAGGSATPAGETAAASGGETAAITGNEPVTLKIIAPLGATTPTGIHDNPVMKKLTEETGITIDWGNKDIISDWFGYVGVMLASGDLPDACTIQFTDDKLRADIFNAGDALALDGLVEKAPNIQKNGKTMMDLLRAFKSNNGDGKLYFLGVQGGSKSDSFSYSDPWGPWFVRWDVYKKIGRPEVKSYDDLLNVMKQMQDAYPATGDGKKTYAMSGFLAETNQFGCWFPESGVDAAMGWMWQNSGPAFFNNNKNNYFMSIYDDKSPWLKALKFWNKAQQMGLVDPECYTMKLTQYTEKLTAGRILLTPVTWAGSASFNAAMQSDGNNEAGYAAIPFPFMLDGAAKDNMSYAYYPGGWNGYWISSKSKNAGRVIQLFDYAFSEDGMNFFLNGVEGTDWTRENGKRVRSADVIKGFQTDPDYSKKTGIALYQNLTAFTPTTMLSDGQAMDLGQSVDAVKANMTPFTKAYCQDMGFEYPAQPWLDAKAPIDATYYNYITFGDNADLVEIQAKVNNTMDVYAPQLIACKTDADFDAMWQQFKNEMDAVGYPKLFDAAKAALDKARSVYTPETGFVQD